MDKPRWFNLIAHKSFIYGCYVLITGLFLKAEKKNGFCCTKSNYTFHEALAVTLRQGFIINYTRLYRSFYLQNDC